MRNTTSFLLFNLLPLRKFRVDYSLVGRRDGLSMREPDPVMWRKNDYRRGYAEGLIAAAKRIAQVSTLPVCKSSRIHEVRS